MDEIPWFSVIEWNALFRIIMDNGNANYDGIVNQLLPRALPRRSDAGKKMRRVRPNDL